MNYSASQPIRIFLIDDYKTVLWGLAKLIRGEYPHLKLVGTASTRSDALAGVMLQRPDIVLLDCDLDDNSILDFLPKLAGLGSHRILVLTGQTYPHEFCHQALVLGACGTVSKDAPATLLLDAIECIYKEGLWPGKMSLSS